MHLLSPCSDREGWGGGLGGSDVKEKVMGELPMRGDSGGGVSQPISDTGEPFLTYGVASRMYLTKKESRQEGVSVNFKTE